MRLWRLLGHYDSVTTSYTACAGAKQTSPYTPDFSGRLVGLRGVVAGGAATSLVQHVQFKLTSTTFVPNEIHAAAQGAGIQTAPAVSMGPILDWQVDQPVQAGVTIHVEGRNEAGAETVVTPEVMLYGCFEVGGR
jgi:hypothetical protein